jgi:hypothetical protein
MGDMQNGLLLSVFGGDNEIAAISAAVTEKASFTLDFPDGETVFENVTMGENAANFRGTIMIPGHKRPVRHLVVVSQNLRQNGRDGVLYLLNYTSATAWALMAASMGLPVLPEWGDWVLQRLEESKRMQELSGFGCNPLAIRITRDEVLGWLEEGVRSKKLRFPEQNGPIYWPEYKVADVLRPQYSVPA